MLKKLNNTEGFEVRVARRRGCTVNFEVPSFTKVIWLEESEGCISRWEEAVDSLC